MRRILIATENSPCSHTAVRRFVELMGGQPIEVYALSVIPPVTGYQTVEQAEEELEAGLEAADVALDAAAIDGAEGGFTIRLMRRVGDPVSLIVSTAHQINADLIVLGTHGQDALVRLTGGSVAEGVLHQAPCGVLIYPYHALALEAAD